MTGTTTRSPKGKAGGRRPVTDPRIEARRREVAKTEGKKRLRLLVALSVITLGSIGSLLLLQSSWLDVDEIVVVGHEHTDPEAVRSVSGIVVGAPLVDLDLSASERAIEALPWVATATVSREWNGTVTVSVTERVAAIALPTARPDTDGFMLVDAAGRQLGPIPDRPAWASPINGLVASGVPGQPAPTEVHGVIRLLSLMTPDQLSGVSSISVVERNLVLDLLEGGTVDLGNESGLNEKLVSYDTIRAAVDLRCLHRIDLRVHTAPAITRISATGETGQALSDLVNCT
jgi:cell division protein FtsQ